ncbi:MAG TPA: hypothetical protein GXX72_02800 [Clostridiaceae bacterium]|nr:hypothetical protein [Clostridiaceae bacterium]
MKNEKTIVIILCAITLFTLISCSSENISVSDINASNTENASVSLTDIMNEICEGVDLPANDVFTLDQSNFEDYSFVPWDKSIEAVCSEGKITTSAHSLVLIRTQTENAELLAKNIAEKADTRKWVCVEAEVGKVFYAKAYVLMIMTYNDVLDDLQNNFLEFVGSDPVKFLDINH